MAIIFTFSCSQFHPCDEPENSINPIAGYAVLDWLAECVESYGFQSRRPPAEEDWGWYLYINNGSNTYMIGSCDQSEFMDGRADWLIQVHKHRSLKDKLFGRNKLAKDDPLALSIGHILKNEQSISEIKMEWHA